MHEGMLPNVLRDVDLGDHVLEVGPGPGVVTDWLRERVPRLTSVEVDPKLAASLQRRMEGTNVTVVAGDASDMKFGDGSFSSAVSFTMLHHVPARLQDRLLAEVCRVLRPGGVFIGTDSTPTFMWNVYHLFDDRNPVDPDTFAGRLEAAGFTDASARRWGKSGFGFRARKPGGA